MSDSEVRVVRHTVIVCLLWFIVIATYKVISEWVVMTCDSAHSLQLYNAASVGHQNISIMT